MFSITSLFMILFVLVLATLAWKLKFIPFGMMAALTTDRLTEIKEIGLKAYAVAASTIIYDGSIVAKNAGGYLVPASDTTALQVVGVAHETIDNSAGADAALNCRVKNYCVARFDASSITQAMIGQVMYVVDDHTFDDGPGTNAIKAGRLVEFISTTEGWLEVRPTGPGSIVANADATYGQPEADLINELKDIINKRIL